MKDWKLPSDTKYPTPAFESSLEVLVSLWKINSLPYKYLNELQIAKYITLHINCLGKWEETLWNSKTLLLAEDSNASIVQVTTKWYIVFGPKNEWAPCQFSYHYGSPWALELLYFELESVLAWMLFKSQPWIPPSVAGKSIGTIILSCYSYIHLY